MKRHASKNGGETGWTRTPACRPLGHINRSGVGARYYVAPSAADVTCAKCHAILMARQDRPAATDSDPVRAYLSSIGRRGGKANSPAQRAQRAEAKPGAGRPRRRQSLRQAVELVRSGRGLHDVARCGLAGCPVGGWPETRQALRRISDELPPAAARAYTVAQLVESLYAVDAAGRYQWRD